MKRPIDYDARMNLAIAWLRTQHIKTGRTPNYGELCKALGVCRGVPSNAAAALIAYFGGYKHKSARVRFVYHKAGLSVFRGRPKGAA